MMFRFLVGAAAVAIIGFVGFFAYERIIDHFETKAAQRADWCRTNRTDLDRIRRGVPTMTGKTERVLAYDVARCNEDGV